MNDYPQSDSFDQAVQNLNISELGKPQVPIYQCNSLSSVNLHVMQGNSENGSEHLNRNFDVWVCCLFFFGCFVIMGFFFAGMFQNRKSQ